MLTCSCRISHKSRHIDLWSRVQEQPRSAIQDGKPQLTELGVRSLGPLPASRQQECSAKPRGRAGSGMFDVSLTHILRGMFPSLSLVSNHVGFGVAQALGRETISCVCEMLDPSGLVIVSRPRQVPYIEDVIDCVASANFHMSTSFMLGAVYIIIMLNTPSRRVGDVDGQHQLITSNTNVDPSYADTVTIPSAAELYGSRS